MSGNKMHVTGFKPRDGLMSTVNIIDDGIEYLILLGQNSEYPATIYHEGIPYAVVEYARKVFREAMIGFTRKTTDLRFHEIEVTEPVTEQSNSFTLKNQDGYLCQVRLVEGIIHAEFTHVDGGRIHRESYKFDEMFITEDGKKFNCAVIDWGWFRITIDEDLNIRRLINRELSGVRVGSYSLI